MSDPTPEPEPIPLQAMAAEAHAATVADREERAAARLAERIAVGIRLVKTRLGVETVPDEWTRWNGNGTDAAITIDGVVFHTWVQSHSGSFGSTDELRTGDHTVFNLAHLGDLLERGVAELAQP